MALYPGALPAAGSASPSDTLAAAGHTSLHNTVDDEARALGTKVGTGASTPTSGTVLRGNGVGTSAWGQAVLTSDVTGTLPVANGGIGQNSLTGLTLPSATLANPAISGTVSGGATYTSPILTTPTIADYTNSTHTHASTAQGGLLNGANAITDGTITPAELESGTGSSWAWQSWTPTFTNFTKSSATITAKYIQIGKTVHFKLGIVLSGSTMGSNPTFTLPITSVAITSALHPLGVCVLDDTGAGTYNGQVTWASTTTGIFRSWDANNNGAAITVTAPFTWADGDGIFCQGSYEAA